jgi:uncharacterized membrane protein
MDQEKKSMYIYSIILLIFALIMVYIIQSGILEEIYWYIKNIFTEQNNASFKPVKLILKDILFKSNHNLFL